MCSFNMEKRSFSQLELFSQTKQNYHQPKGISNSFLSYIYNYEKTILITIGFIIIGIVSFSLGVEKGKRLSIVKFNSHLDMAAKTKLSESVQIITQQQNQTAIKKEDASVKIQPQPIYTKDSIRNYTIQVATYQTNSHAQREVEILRKKGFNPLVLSKGEYTVVCVGNFSNKETAKSLLSELKKRYRDCFIRRL